MEEFHSAKELLKNPTPFWIEVDEPAREAFISFITSVSSDPASIYFHSCIDVFRESIIRINNKRKYVYRKWNKIKIIKLSIELQETIITQVFSKDSI